MRKNTLNLNGNLYVRISFLTEYGLSEKSLKNRLSDNRSGKTKSYQHLKDPNDTRINWIEYQSIPPATRRKKNLPIEEVLLREIDVEKTERVSNLIESSLSLAYQSGYIHFCKHYHGVFADHEVIENHAKTHAVLDSCLQLKGIGIPIKNIYVVYKSIEGLMFPGKSLKSFYHKLKTFDSSGAEAIIHGSQGKQRLNKKIHEAQIKYIEGLYRDPVHMSGPEITGRLNSWSIRKGYKQVSVSTVRRVISKPFFQNVNRPYRNGKEWVMNNFEPFKLRFDAELQGEQWQLDGTRFQIPYFDTSKNKPSFMHVFVVLDAHSRKVIGYSLDKSENHRMITNALKMAVENCNYFPRQILRDNATCFKKDELKYILQFASYLGCEDRSHAISNARDKSQVERYFGVSQSKILKFIDGYVGEGIRSKRLESRPNEAILKKIFQSKNLRSKFQLEKLAGELVNRYNNLRSLKDNLSPNMRYEISKTHENIVPISTKLFRLLFWERKVKLIKKSMIILSQGSHRNEQFQYIIENINDRNHLNLTEVIVCYNREDRSSISLFDKNEKWLLDLKLEEKVKNVRDSKPNQVKDQPILDSSLRARVNKGGARGSSRDKLYKKPATLDVLLVKTKDND